MRPYKTTFTILLLLFSTLPNLANNNAYRIKISGNSYSDETILRLHGSATSGFDGGLDAWKLFSPNPSVPSIYTQISPNQELSINALPEYNKDTSIILYAYIPVSGTYTITVEEIFELGINYKASITDLGTGVHYELNGDTSFSLNAVSQQHMAMLRFNVSTPLMSSTTNESCTGLNDGSVIIDNPGSLQWDYALHDQNDQLIITGTAQASIKNLSNLSPGNYYLISEAQGIVDTAAFQILAAPNLLAHFSMVNDTVYLTEGATPDIQNNCQNALNYFWDFGDGNTSTMAQPVHAYAGIGQYVIELTATQNNCTSVYSTVIEVLSSPNLSTHIGIVESNQLKVANSGQGGFDLYFNSDSQKNISIYNLNGQLLDHYKINSNYLKLSLNNYSNGVYLLQVHNNDGTFYIKKLVF